MIISPDPDSGFRARKYDNNPDDTNHPECPECGAPYDTVDGHDCEEDE